MPIHYCMSCGGANDHSAKSCKKCQKSFASAAPLNAQNFTTPQQNSQDNFKSINEIIAKVQPLGDDEVDTFNPNTIRLTQLIKQSQ